MIVTAWNVDRRAAMEQKERLASRERRNRKQDEVDEQFWIDREVRQLRP